MSQSADLYRTRVEPVARKALSARNIVLISAGITAVAGVSGLLIWHLVRRYMRKA